MYLDGVLIEAKDLINGVSIVQAERVEKVEYFHIELDSHDVIIAEGALSESFIDDDSRGMFHNAHEFRVLYPAAASGLAHYCAPRLLRRLRGRGGAAATLCCAPGLSAKANEPRIGMLCGKVDRVAPRRIEGWAQNADHPEAPVCLDIYAGGQPARSGSRQQLSKRSRTCRPRQRPSQLCIHAAGGPRLCSRCGGSPPLARRCPAVTWRSQQARLSIAAAA